MLFGLFAKYMRRLIVLLVMFIQDPKNTPLYCLDCSKSIREMFYDLIWIVRMAYMSCYMFFLISYNISCTWVKICSLYIMFLFHKLVWFVWCSNEINGSTCIKKCSIKNIVQTWSSVVWLWRSCYNKHNGVIRI